MNLLKRTLIEKAGYENGFENNCLTESASVCLSSARHSAQAVIAEQGDTEQWSVTVTSVTTPNLFIELTRSFAHLRFENGIFLVSNLVELANFLRRASAFAQALPNQAVLQFTTAVDAVMANAPDGLKGTEIERMVKQRIGQETYRNAMLDYWGNACAVTGITLKEVLRASHAKPWASCKTDEERLDVFNGFLLCANLDALFDRFLISFDNSGSMLISSAISATQRKLIGLDQPLVLRWLDNNHLGYLEYHRNVFLKS